MSFSDAAGADRSEAEWRTVFFDDFTSEGLDTTKWKPEISCWGGGNNERQCYTSRPENVSIEDGILHLNARKETFFRPDLSGKDFQVRLGVSVHRNIHLEKCAHADSIVGNMAVFPRE